MDPAILSPRTAAINSSRGMLIAVRGTTLAFAATNLMDTAPLVMCLRKYVMFATTFLPLVLGVDIEEL